MEFGIYDSPEKWFDPISFAITKKGKNVEFLRITYPSRLPKNVKIGCFGTSRKSPTPEGVTFTGERAKTVGYSTLLFWTANLSLMAHRIINADDYYGKNAFESAASFIRNNVARDLWNLLPIVLKNTLSETRFSSRGRL